MINLVALAAGRKYSNYSYRVYTCTCKHPGQRLYKLPHAFAGYRVLAIVFVANSITTWLLKIELNQHEFANNNQYDDAAIKKV